MRPTLTLPWSGPQGGEEAAPEQPEAEAPGEGDEDAQYEITQGGEMADAQVLADATQEQFDALLEIAEGQTGPRGVCANA